jgi:hypothetical protein
MKINELRMGNIIIQGNVPTIVEKLNMSIDDWDRVNNKRALDCNPIPLTEDWLIEFGFVYNGWNYDFEKYVFHAQGKDEKGQFYNTEFGIRKDKVVYNICYKIEYVHQLQNLYYALTQKEL